MNDFYQENKTILFIFTVFLLVVAIVFYFWLVHPLKGDLEQTNTNIEQLEEEKLLITTQISNFDDEDFDIDIDELLHEKKIPRERRLDDYILSLQGLEFITNSKIESVAIAYDSGTQHIEVAEEEEDEEDSTSETDANDEDVAEEVEEDTDADTADETEIEQPEIDPIIVKEKPESLEVMVVTIQAASPNFKEFLELIEAIEKQDRVSIVSNLNFKSPTENDVYTSEFEVDEEKIEFTASLTTFYYPE